MSLIDGPSLDDAQALDKVADALNKLGLADAMSQMGAVELLSREVKEGSRRIADAIEHLADAVREGRG